MTKVSRSNLLINYSESEKNISLYYAIEKDEGFFQKVFISDFPLDQDFLSIEEFERSIGEWISVAVGVLDQIKIQN